MKCYVIMGSLNGQENSRESQGVYLNKARADAFVERENKTNGNYPGEWYLWVEEQDLIED